MDASVVCSMGTETKTLRAWPKGERCSGCAKYGRRISCNMRPGGRAGTEGGVNGLALCAGVGGLELGLEIAFRNLPMCRGRRKQPASRAALPNSVSQAKVFRDVVGFDGRPFHGAAWIASLPVFPVEPHSVARKAQKGLAMKRYGSGPNIARIIGEDSTRNCCPRERHWAAPRHRYRWRCSSRMDGRRAR